EGDAWAVRQWPNFKSRYTCKPLGRTPGKANDEIGLGDYPGCRQEVGRAQSCHGRHDPELPQDLVGKQAAAFGIYHDRLGRRGNALRDVSPLRKARMTSPRKTGVVVPEHLAIVKVRRKILVGIERAVEAAALEVRERARSERHHVEAHARRITCDLRGKPAQ